MSTNALLIAGLWGYAEADPTVVAILVAIVVALAVVYLVVRSSKGGSTGQGGRKDADRRG